MLATLALLMHANVVVWWMVRQTTGLFYKNKVCKISKVFSEFLMLHLIPIIMTNEISKRKYKQAYAYNLVILDKTCRIFILVSTSPPQRNL